VIPADSKNIREEYKILQNELKKFNKELLDKKRLLVVSKSDLLDEELMKELKKELPRLPYLFISSATGYNILQLKDKLWSMLNE
jgi:GTP-binding protein